MQQAHGTAEGDLSKSLQWGVLDSNPCRGVRDIPGNGTRTRFLSVREFRSLLAHTSEGGQARNVIDGVPKKLALQPQGVINNL